MALRVLLVDDNEEFMPLLKDGLSKFDEFEVIGEANSCASALEFLQREYIDIILLDIVMPDMDGLELLDTLQPFNNQPKVFIISAVSNNAVIRYALKHGAAAYYTKPIDPAATLGHILHYMKMHSKD